MYLQLDTVSFDVVDNMRFIECNLVFDAVSVCVTVRCPSVSVCFVDR